jgi:hypothetical protein
METKFDIVAEWNGELILMASSLTALEAFIQRHEIAVEIASLTTANISLAVMPEHRNDFSVTSRA